MIYSEHYLKTKKSICESVKTTRLSVFRIPCYQLENNEVYEKDNKSKNYFLSERSEINSLNQQKIRCANKINRATRLFLARSRVYENLIRNHFLNIGD